MIPLHSFSYCIPYVLVVFVLMFSTVRVNNTGTIEINKNLRMFQVVFFVFTFLYFFGLRGYVSNDFQNYYPFFEETPTLWQSFGDFKSYFKKYGFWEKGFIVYTILVKSIYPDYFFFQFISFATDFLLSYYFFKYYLEKYFILGFFFFFVFNGIYQEFNFFRNIKSLMLFLVSIRYLENKSYLMYLVLNILGIQFHTSSFIYLLATPFLYKKYPRKSILILYLIGNVFYLLKIKWIRILVDYVFTKISGRLAGLVLFYVQGGKSDFQGFTIGFLERTFSFWLFYFAMKKEYNVRKYRIFYNSLFLYLFVYLFFSEFWIFHDRLGGLFVFSYWILYPHFYSNLNKENKILFLSVFGLYSIMKLAMGYSYNIYFWDSCLNLKFDFLERKEALRFYGKVIGF